MSDMNDDGDEVDDRGNGGGGLDLSRFIPQIDTTGAMRTGRDVVQTTVMIAAAVFAGLTLAGASGFGGWYASYAEAGLVTFALVLGIVSGHEKIEALGYVLGFWGYLLFPVFQVEMGWSPWLPVAWGILFALASIAVNFGEIVGRAMLAASKFKKV